VKKYWSNKAGMLYDKIDNPNSKGAKKSMLGSKFTALRREGVLLLYRKLPETDLIY
jgi:hypothetical protein